MALIPNYKKGYLIYYVSERYGHAILTGDRSELTDVEVEKLDRFLAMVDHHASGVPGIWEAWIERGHRCHIESREWSAYCLLRYDAEASE
jgi:hypothetical protein